MINRPVANDILEIVEPPMVYNPTPPLRPVVSQRATGRIRCRLFVVNMLLGLGAILLWRAPFFFALKPLVWAYLLSWLSARPSVSRWSLLWLIPLMALRPDTMGSLMIIRVASWVGLALFSLWIKKADTRSILMGAAIGMIMTLAGGLYFNYDLLGLGVLALEPLAGLTMAYIMAPAFSALPLKADYSKKLSLETRISLLFVGGVIFLGVQGFRFQGIDLGMIVSMLMVIIVADRFDYASSAALGLTFSLIHLVFIGGRQESIFYGSLGLLCGLGREMGRWGLVPGILMSFGLLGWGNGRSWRLDLLNYIPSLALALFYTMLPGRLLSFLPERLNRRSEMDRVDPASQEERLRSVLTERLKGLAEVFGQLSQSFVPEELTEATKPMDIYSMIEEISKKNCQQCSGYHLCWVENFYTTYREVFDLIAVAEMNGQVSSQQVKGRLGKDCFQQMRLISSINHRMEQQKTAVYWQRRLEENRSFLSGQLQGVASIMTNLAQEIRFNAEFRTELEDELKHAFNRWGFTVRELVALSMGKDRLEIRIDKHSCGGCQECRFVVAPLVSQLMGQKFIVWQRECRFSGEAVCRFTLCPARKYQVQSAVCKLPRQGYNTSGDSHSQLELREGYFVGMLSDGMGVGPKAALESSATISILEQLLKAGLNRDFAVQMVNTVLLLRNQEETFATLDVALLDLYTAEAEFVKIGAAPTYIKRGKEVSVIRSTSLPVGILSNVDAETSKFQLEPGDLVVMVTDGVSDSKINEQKDDWIWRALTKMDLTGPEALGQFLLRAAAGDSSVGASDDMTVVVLQLQEQMEEDPEIN